MKKRKIITIIILVVVAIIISSIISFLTINYFKTNERKTKLKETNTTASIYDSDIELLDDLESDHEELVKHIKENKESNNYGMYVIPGLEATKTISCNTKKIDMCTAMTPQGLAVMDKYIFVSAYCKTHKHNSVIYVIDRLSKKFIKEIVLDSNSHVGGLAFDTKNNVLWISEYKNNISYVGSLKLNNIESYNDNSKVIKYDKLIELKDIDRISSLTYDKNEYLIAGYFTKKGDSHFNLYKINSKGIVNSNPEDYYITSSKIQGIATNPNTLSTILSKSYGNDKSKILIFDNLSLDKILGFYKDENAEYKIKLPSKLEQIYIYNDRLYMLFESAAFNYRIKGDDFVDRIISIKF